MYSGQFVAGKFDIQPFSIHVSLLMLLNPLSNGCHIVLGTICYLDILNST